MIDADETVGHERGGRIGLVMEFSLVPGAFQSEDHALVSIFCALLP
jgi:hypothetical protein